MAKAHEIVVAERQSATHCPTNHGIEPGAVAAAGEQTYPHRASPRVAIGLKALGILDMKRVYEMRNRFAAEQSPRLHTGNYLVRLRAGVYPERVSALPRSIRGFVRWAGTGLGPNVLICSRSFVSRRSLILMSPRRGCH